MTEPAKSNGIAGDQLRAFVERIERLEEEKQVIATRARTSPMADLVRKRRPVPGPKHPLPDRQHDPLLFARTATRAAESLDGRQLRVAGRSKPGGATAAAPQEEIKPVTDPVHMRTLQEQTRLCHHG